MKLMQEVALRGGTIKEVVELLVENGRWWLVPMLGILMLAALLLLVLQAAEYVAPFVYSIF